MLIRNGALERLRENVADPFWFIPRMTITGKNGRAVRLTLRDEQTDLLKALVENPQTLVLKSRQIGSTTLIMAFLLHRAMTLGGQYDVLSVLHEKRGCGRVNLMLKDYLRTLPPELQPKVEKANSMEIEFLLPGGRKCAFRQVMAGGRDQGRSYTYRAAHLSEAAFYPKGSAAMSGVAVDEDVYASVLATMPTTEEDPEVRLVIESTANGPSGLYHKLVHTASSSSEWAFRFYPWFAFKGYARTLPSDWKPLPDEIALQKLHGLTDEQLAWRRYKIIDQGIGLQRFRKEYPSTWLEPFLISGGMWFDQDRLNDQAARCDPKFRLKEEGIRKYRAYDENEKYSIGVDPSGGTGNDNSVAVVLDAALRVCLVFSSAKLSPRQFAEVIARISVEYGKPPVIIESNNYGKTVIERCRELGVRLWTDEKGKPWWTDTRSKAKIYDWGRAVIDGDNADLNDPLLIKELQQVREQRDGTIQADDGFHDDHPMALMLALWLARKHYSKQEAEISVARVRELRHKELGLRRK